MKRILLLFLLPVFVLSCSSDDADFSPETPNEYKKIKTISSDDSFTTISYNSNGLISEAIYEGEITLKIKYIYSGNRLVQLETYINNSSTPTIDKFHYSGDLIVKTEKDDSYVEYFYNENGQLIKSLEIHPDYPEFNTEVIYSYSSNGNLYSQMFDGEYYETFEYDNKINPGYYSVTEAFAKISRTYKNNVTKSGDLYYSYEYEGDYPVIEYTTPANITSYYTYY